MKKNLPISQKKKFKYSISFQSFDEESLEAGDSFDSGYEIIDATDFIGDILYKAYFTYGIYMPVAFGTWESTNPLENTDYWEKGIKKYFAIHISNEDETQISKEESDFITFLLSDGHYELNKFREYAVGGVVLGSIALGIGALITYFYFKGKKGGKSKKELVGKTSKSVTYKINGKDRKFPIKDAWKKEHTLENQSEDYEVPQAERFEMGGDASEHYHEIEYGEGGIARAKEVIMNKIGFNEENANYLVSQSEKFSIWLADAILKKDIKVRNDLEESVGRPRTFYKKSMLDFINKRNNHIQYTHSSAIRQILDWLQHPVTPKQNLKELSFDQALEKAREWHNELQVLGGDIDFTEPETHTILKKYPVNSDGIEYYWVFIPSNYCDLESSRMGHCGRTGYGNKLISLRSVKAYGKGHTISDSHVTIAYGSDGMFYQVKGKKNNKPAEKYFPYIFDLLKGMLNNDINKLNSEKIENINSEIEKINKGIENIGNELALIDTKSIGFKAKTDAISFLLKEKGQLEKSLEKIDLDFNFKGFGSEDGAEEDYGFEDMTKEEIREMYDLKPTLFESAEDNYMLLDAGIITLDEFKEIVEREPDTFSSFGNQMKLYERGIINEQPSTTFELEYDCDDVYRLLDIGRDFSDDLVAEILCGDIGELYDGWSYYYDNPSDLVNNLNKENEQSVIDEIVRITKLDESVVKENGIEYYLKGEDENFPIDDFDNIIRAFASAQNQADNGDYYKYLYDSLKSALNELGEVHSLNDEGVKMTIDLSNSMTLEEIAYEMDDYNFSDIADLFSEKIGEYIDKPSLRIDDRYSPYGSSEDFNEYISDIDLEQGYKKGGVLRTKNISTNKKIKNMKSIQNKFDDGGRLTNFNRHISMDSETMSEILKMTNYPLLKEYFVEKNGEIKYDRIKSELEREGVSTGMINNYLSGLFDGYNYSNTDAFKKEMAKLKIVDKEFYDKVMTLYEKISKYPKINVEYADGGEISVLNLRKGDKIKTRKGDIETITRKIESGYFTKESEYSHPFESIEFIERPNRTMAQGGRVTTNDGIIESFLTSNKQLKVGNLSTHFNEYDNQMLLRNYGTLIATRIGNDVEITNIKYSKTTTTITNKIRNMALKKRMNISYVDKFAEGGEAQKVNLGNGEIDLDEAIKIYEEKIKAQGRVVNARDEDMLEKLKKMKNKYTGGGETTEFNYLYIKEVPNGLKLELTDEGINGYKEEEINDMYDLFEDIQANSEMAYIDNAGDMGFGLTEAPIITDGYYYDDMGEFTDEGVEDSKVYVWNDYMIKDLFATLMEQGSVVLTEVKSYNYGGETFTEKYIESQGGVDYYSVDYDDVNAQEFRDDIFDTLEEAKLKFDELCENGKTFEDVPLDNVQLLEVYKSGEYQTLNSKMFYDFAKGGSTDDDRTQYKKAKSWKDIENHPLVDDTSIEENDPSEGKDYWVYLKNGYCWEFPNSEQHIIHEWGVKDTIREFNNSIYRCNCSQCVNEGKYKDGGMTEHGLREGDKIIGENYIDEIYIIDKSRNARIVNLDKGIRMAKGGEAGKYSIIVWETEEDRDAGESFVAEILTNKQEALEKAEKMYYKQDFSAIEVIDENDEVILHLSSNEEDAEDEEDEEGFAEGGSVKKDKLQQARDYWKELEGQMSEKQKKFYNELLKRRQPSFEKNFNDSEIAEYINGEIIEQFGVDLGITKYQITGVNWFKLGFKYIAYREAIEEPEFWEEMNEYAEGGNIIMPKYRVLFVDENGRELDEYFATLTQAKVRFNQYKKDKIETNIEKVIKEKDGDYNYESTEYSYTPDDEDNFAEGGEVEDWMEEALASLIEETGNEDLDITMVSDNGNEFFAGNDMEEYRVFKTEKDAEEKAIEQVREDLKENPDYFNQDWLMNYIDGRDFFEEALNEMNYSYVEDIASETSGTKYNNRLIDELVENGLMDEDDAILENAEEIADELKYDYVLLLTEEKLDEGNNGLDYFINNFGEKETLKMVINNNLIDIDEASQDAVNSDGIAHFIASYDGRTLYLSNNNVAYRNN